jgi:ATP-dependent exoDNAse (exonuclease V) beta subunit
LEIKGRFDVDGAASRRALHVGDPKQAIYRFRRADIEIYNRAKILILAAPNGCVIDVTANFRSRPQIILHVNETFRQTLAAEGQPGFVPLQATVKPLTSRFPSAVKMTVETIAKASADVLFIWPW